MNFRSLQKLTFISVGFLAGVIWIAACGGGSASIAETIATALEVSYDNATSGLTATTVQAALDELKVAVDAVPAAYTDADAQAALADQDVTLGAVTADSFAFAAAKTGYINIPGVAFAPNGSAVNYSAGQNNLTAIRVPDTAGGLFHATVHLPQGAVITEFKTYVDNDDNAGGSAGIELQRINTSINADADAAEPLASTTTNVGEFEETDSTITADKEVVDNASYAYIIEAYLDDTAGNGDSDIELYGARITYTYDSL